MHGAAPTGEHYPGRAPDVTGAEAEKRQRPP